MSETVLRVAGWNINSLRLRMGLLKEVVADLSPDVICLQETKVTDADFPQEAVRALGFPYLLFRGMKSYNGVAVLSRYPLKERPDLMPVWAEKEDCRHLAAEIEINGHRAELHNFYIPAGGDLPDPAVNPKFAHKLQFLEELTAYFAERQATAARSQEKIILLGDFNIAPYEHDVWSHKQLLNVVSHTPVECEALLKWLNCGFTDAVRHFVPLTEKLYTWWSYRNRDWALSNRGRRLDHIWVSEALKDHLHNYRIAREFRSARQPSDHVPLAVDLVFS